MFVLVISALLKKSSSMYLNVRMPERSGQRGQPDDDGKMAVKSLPDLTLVKGNSKPYA
jgi:hypothetical protein